MAAAFDPGLAPNRLAFSQINPKSALGSVAKTGLWFSPMTKNDHF